MIHDHCGARAAARCLVRLLAAAMVAVALGGCATNLTGFDFPVFGLTKKATGPSHATASGSESSPALGYQ